MKKDNEAALNRFIRKGGSVTEKKENKGRVTICLRIPKEMIIYIDSVIENQLEFVRFTRTSWILQALQEKLSSLKNE